MPFVLGIFLAILSFIWWTRVEPVGGGRAEEQEQFTEVVLSGLPKLLERWQQGDLEETYATKYWACDELPFSTTVAPAYLQCNPHYLECWARGKSGVPAVIPVELDGKTYNVKLRATYPEIGEYSKGKRHGSWVTRGGLDNPIAPWSGLLVELEVEGVKGFWSMILEDTCRMQDLPERRYSYGPRPQRHERVQEMDWDNSGRKISIDKFLVSRSDVNQWVLTARVDKVKISEDRKNWALPSTELSEEQQTEYCAWLGKRRMEAHIWDAATMPPANVKRPFPDFSVKPWLPWSRDKKGSFFEAAELDTQWTPRQQDCELAFVSECKDLYAYRPHSSDNVSWMGIYHVLGGTPEQFRNPVQPQLDLKASSVNLLASSPLHQLGRRQEGKDVPAGFRCYREEFE